MKHIRNSLSTSSAICGGAHLSRPGLVEDLVLGTDYLSEADLGQDKGLGTSLIEADLSGAKLNGANLAEVMWTSETKWPESAACEGARIYLVN